MSSQKIYPNPVDLRARLDEHRARGEVIVFANGCFELLHVGHIRYLAASKEEGDVLLVAINTDASMARIKPDRRPVMPDFERYEVVAALGMVDYVVPLEANTPAELLELLRPDVQTKGTDYTLERMPERVVIEGYGGRIAFVGDPKDHSTTDIRDALKREAERGRAGDQRK